MDIESTARAISNMEIRGAAKISRAAVSALKDLVNEYQGGDVGALRERILEAKERLLSSRPTAISLWNGLQSATKGLNEASTLDELRELVTENSQRFITRSHQALGRIGEIGSNRIRDGDRILTHCNSSAVLSVIRTAFNDGKDVEVFATESRPNRQGFITVRELSEEGIPATLIMDSAVRWTMRDIDLVLVGADTVTSDGVVINKIGTSQVALIADEARTPFMVCAETYKFSPRTVSGELVDIEQRGREEVVEDGEIPEDVKVFNPVFDATPPKYIDSIITEVGLIPPYAAYEIIVKELGQEFLFEELPEPDRSR